MASGSRRTVTNDLPEVLRPLCIAEHFTSEDDDSDGKQTCSEEEDGATPLVRPPGPAEEESLIEHFASDGGDFHTEHLNESDMEQEYSEEEDVATSLGRPSGPAEEESLIGSSLAEMPTDLRSLLALNRAYQALLDNAICELAERLEENRQLRMELLAKLSERSARPAKPKVRKNWYHSLVFHHPYFRDINGMRAPMNEDEKIKRANKEMDPYLTPPLHWSAEENRMLVEAVKSNVLQQSLESMMDRKEALAQKILETEDPDQIAEITARIDQLEEQMAKTRDLSLEELLEQATRPIDWLRIAAVDMRTNRTAFDCEARWRNLLDVRLNQGPWTPEEDERLTTVAAKWKGRNWDQIAQELKTNRSAYQCAQRYTSHLVKCHKTGSFTEEENHKLKRLISVCSDGDNISWSQVSHYMDSRSKKQLINRYHRSLHPNMQRGRWSAQEDVMLLVAVKLYGDVSWSKVASMVPGRTHGQCRDRYMDNFAQRFVSGPFTSDEDCTLLQLVQKYGAGHWAMAARDMPWRAPNTLLMRYRRLCETLNTKEPTVADLERSLAVPVAPMTEMRCARLTGMDKRMDLYRRIRRLLNTDVMKRAALSLVKNRNENVSRETCMRLYRKMLQFQQGTRPPKNSRMQGCSLNKAIAKYAQPLHRPMLPSLAAYEHQEWQAVANVLHDLHGLSRPPPNPEVEEVGTVPIFENFFSKEVLGVPDVFEPKKGCLVLPLLPPNETTVATYGRLLDRFDSGSILESLLVGNKKFPELSAAFDTDSAEYICCTECVSRSLLEFSSVATGAPVPCGRCEDLRAMRKSYDVLQARVISYFFWPAVLDSMNVAETVELPAEPAKKRAKIYRRKAKLKKPWVKAKWMQRKQAAAEAAAAAGATAQQVDAPGEDGSAGPSRT